MTKTLYVSTDAFEAEDLVEPDLQVGQDARFTYRDMTAQEGLFKEKEIGFNPMCRVEFPENLPDSQIELIAKSLVKEGLLVSFGQNGNSQTYKPSNMDLRTEVLEHALRIVNNQIPPRDWEARRRNEYAAGCLFNYSNNPDSTQEIRNPWGHVACF